MPVRVSRLMFDDASSSEAMTAASSAAGLKPRSAQRVRVLGIGIKTDPFKGKSRIRDATNAPRVDARPKAGSNLYLRIKYATSASYRSGAVVDKNLGFRTEHGPHV